MSQGLHQGIFSFSTNGFDRSTAHHHHHSHHQEEQHQHVAQQSRRDKLRVQQQGGFAPPPPPPLVAIEEEIEEQDHGELPAVYETAAGMWSEMFNFPVGGGAFAPPPPPAESPASVPVVMTEEWYGGNRSQGIAGGLDPLGDSKQSSNNTVDINRESLGHQNHHHISSLNAESAAAMQLFLMNPQPRSPSPPPAPSTTTSTPLHLLLSNQSATSSSSNPPLHQAVYHHSTAGGTYSATQIPFPVVASSSRGGVGDVDIVDNPATQLNSSNKIGGVVEGQGLSLTLSSSLQHLEAAKTAGHEEFRMGDDGVLYYGSRAGGGAASLPSYQLRNLGNHQTHQSLQIQGTMGQNVHENIGFRSSSSGLGMISLLRNSRYVKAARELLEEFCSVGRGEHLRNNRLGRHSNNTNLSSDQHYGGGAGVGGSSSSSKDLPPLSAADRIEYQRKKTKLLTMLDEVDRRYNHYCEQLQTVVSSFDSVMGFGAATPYTGLAQKAMSRHFRCLKDAIMTQLKLTCELLGERESAGGSGITKGETPRLRLLEQSLRQQRVFHQMGMMEQEAWRPQRGLPERSVNILRAWLFEHFLHPYPSDADKHLLSRQTGLSRNQVSNWFINARVRLWKPMVEEMYQKEAKEEEDDEEEEGVEEEEREKERRDGQSNSSTRTPTPREPVMTVSTATSTTSLISGKRTEINATESDPSHLHTTSRQCFSENQAARAAGATSGTGTAIPNYRHEVGSPMALAASDMQYHRRHQQQQQQQHQLMAAVDVVDFDDTCLHGSIVSAEHRTTVAAAATGLPNPNGSTSGSTLVNFRTTNTTTGDVSLTLGLRHAGNLPETNRFSLTDFGGC